MIHMSVTKGMYDLPQSSLLANELLEKRLNKHGYSMEICPKLWQHKTRPITFCLTVDDFSFVCIGREHSEHLLHILSQYYNITSDWSGTRYICIHLH